MKGEPDDSYAVASITYVPETVDIGGDAAVIKDINSLEINDVDISGCTSDVETTLDVSKYLPDGVVVTRDSAYINVKVAIEKSVTRNISVKASDVTIMNKQSGYDYEIITGSESAITVSGISSEVSKITAKNLGLIVDASKLSEGENTVTLEVDDGDYYSVNSQSTVTVKVTAK